ncbi:MAG: hypothetical protein ACRDTT_33280, partial [Pseudonocardiaceae bacterium]
DKLGPVGAYRAAPQIFQTAATLDYVDTLIMLPLDDDEPLTASAASSLPSIGLFTPPADMPPGTGHYVDHEPRPDGRRRVWGRLAEWNVPHIGFDGAPVYAPRDTDGYRWFHTKSAWAQGPSGPERIKVGHVTFHAGHAPVEGLDHVGAAAFYDNSAWRGAKVRMIDDEHGPAYAGVTVSGLTDAAVEEFGESDLSGDWRRIMGRLRLIAAHCVNVGGIPKIGLSLAASGEPLALVADAKAWGNPAAVDVEALAAAVVSRMEQRTELGNHRDELLSELDDDEDRLCELLIELYADEFDFENVTEGELTADAMPVSRMPPRLQQSYLTGKVGNRIRWGAPGDFMRCVTQAKVHGMG